MIHDYYHTRHLGHLRHPLESRGQALTGVAPAGPLSFYSDLVVMAAPGRRFFSELTERRLCRLAVTSANQLVEVTTQYIDRRDEHPSIVCTFTGQKVLRKVDKANAT